MQIRNPLMNTTARGGTVMGRQRQEQNRTKKRPKTQHIPRTKFGGQAAHIEHHIEGMPPNTYPTTSHPPPITYHMDIGYCKKNLESSGNP